MSGDRRVRDFQKSDPHLRSHPAFVKFKRRLGCSATLAHGILAGLWAFAFDFAKDGDLSRFDAEDLAESLEWDIDGATVMAALEGSFLKKGVINDWGDWGGALFARRKHDAERQWDSRKAKNDRNGSEQENVSQGVTGCHKMSCDTLLSISSTSTRVKGLRPLTPTSPFHKGDTGEVEEVEEVLVGDVVAETLPGEEVLSGEVVVDDLFEMLFWPMWPNRHGSKKSAKARFNAASVGEQERMIRAEGHLLSTIDQGLFDMEFLPRAENFVGGRKAFYEEWADGPPAKYRQGNGRRSSHSRQVDRLVEEMERGQR